MNLKKSGNIEQRKFIHSAFYLIFIYLFQLEGKPPNKREMGLQKSTSQQQIINKNQHPSLPSSKSTTSLISKSEDVNKKVEVKCLHL